MPDFLVYRQRFGEEWPQRLGADGPGQAKDAEGVAGDAGDPAALAKVLVEALGDAAQDGVAVAVAEGFVGFGKLVDVYYADGVPLGGTGADMLIDRLDEGGAGRQLDQPVDVGLVMERLSSLVFSAQTAMFEQNTCSRC